MEEKIFIPDEWDLLEAKEQINETEMVNAEAHRDLSEDDFRGFPVPEKHEDWLEIRKKGIGGSDVAGILGVSHWASPLTVYLDKVGETQKKETSEKMEIGTELEPYLREKFIKKALS